MKLIIENLTKVYPSGVIALKDVSLIIEKGVFGLLGPNGAGKTTLMKIISSLMEPTNGKVYFNGMNIHENKIKLRKMLGYLPQEFGIIPELTAWEFLDFFASLKGYNRRGERSKIINELLEWVDLLNYKDRKLKTFSGGMKQRIGIAQALIGNSKLLIVDEPTAGLDPEERIKFRNLLSELSGERIVILSTHIVGDVEYTCQQLAIISHGEILKKEKTNELISSVEGKVFEANINEELFRDIKNKTKIISVKREHKEFLIRFLSESLNYWISSKEVRPTLEDAYMYFLNKQ